MSSHKIKSHVIRRQIYFLQPRSILWSRMTLFDQIADNQGQHHHLDNLWGSVGTLWKRNLQSASRANGHKNWTHHFHKLQKKERDLTQSYDKSPYTSRNVKRAK